jgi:hypothetical protein
LRRFDRVVFLLNGVTSRHLAAVHSIMAASPDIPWDTISGPRGRGERISALQNECVRRHPDGLYFKIDEDTLVSHDWVDRLTEAYERHRGDANLSLITPVIPNNAVGFHYLLTRYPDLADEYFRLFKQPITNQCDGPVWKYPQIANWATRKFLDLRAAGEKLRAGSSETYLKFSYRFSINCIVYDYRHWQEIGGVPNDDEIGWSQWITAHGKHIVLATDCIVHHYSFFVQQSWLDRTGLLEDLRAANLPQPPGGDSRLHYYAPRLARIVRQIPATIAQSVKPVQTG